MLWILYNVIQLFTLGFMLGMYFDQLTQLSKKVRVYAFLNLIFYMCHIVLYLTYYYTITEINFKDKSGNTYCFSGFLVLFNLYGLIQVYSIKYTWAIKEVYTLLQVMVWIRLWFFFISVMSLTLGYLCYLCHCIKKPYTILRKRLSIRKNENLPLITVYPETCSICLD